MRLADWLEQQGPGAKSRLADKVGVRWQTIHKIAEGTAPRLSTALAIEKATDGAVTVADLCAPAEATGTDG